MDPVRTLIVSRVAELGLSLSELSLRVGKIMPISSSSSNAACQVAYPRTCGSSSRDLRVDERQLKTAGPKTATGTALSKAVVAGGLKFDRSIPIYGQAIGGKDDEFILTGNQVTEVVAPANLSNVPDAYAVYVVGDFMEPRTSPMRQCSLTRVNRSAKSLCRGADLGPRGRSTAGICEALCFSRF